MEELPDELVLEVFAFVTPKDLCSLSLTCKKFHNISQDSSLWWSAFIREWPKAKLARTGTDGTTAASLEFGIAEYQRIITGGAETSCKSVFLRKKRSTAKEPRIVPADGGGGGGGGGDADSFLEKGNRLFISARDADKPSDAAACKESFFGWASAADTYEQSVASGQYIAICLHNWAVAVFEMAEFIDPEAGSRAWRPPMASKEIADEARKIAFSLFDRSTKQLASYTSAPLTHGKLIYRLAIRANTARRHGEAIDLAEQALEKLDVALPLSSPGAQVAEVQNMRGACFLVVQRAAHVVQGAEASARARAMAEQAFRASLAAKEDYAPALVNLASVLRRNAEVMWEAEKPQSNPKIPAEVRQKIEGLFAEVYERLARALAVDKGSAELTIEDWAKSLFEHARTLSGTKVAEDEARAESLLRESASKFETITETTEHFTSFGITLLCLSKLILRRGGESNRSQAEELGEKALRLFTGAKLPPISTYNCACMHSVLSHEAECQKWLKECLECGGVDAEMLESDTDFDNMRDKPWFLSFLADLKSKPADQSQQAVNRICCFY